MKVLFIPHLPTLYGRRYQVCKQLAASGNEVHMILWDMPYPLSLENLINGFKSSWKKSNYQVDNINMHKVRRLPFFLPPVNRIWFQKQVKDIIRKNDLQVIISQSFFSETEPPKGLPLFYDLNDNHKSFADIYGSLAYKLSYKILRVQHTVDSQLKRAQAIFAVSDLLVEFGKKYSSKVYKIPNGVDIDSSISKNPKNLKYGDHSIVYVSTFGKWSRIIEIIELVDKMKIKIPDIKLVLIGDGTEFKSAKRLIEQKSLKKYVYLLGSIKKRDKLFKIVQNCRVCLNISEKNAFRDSASPIKIFEYSALSKVIVSTNLSEVVSLELPNVITYDTDNNGSIQLEKAILKAFKNEKDYSYVQKRIINDYSWKNLIKHMSEIIKDEVKL